MSDDPLSRSIEQATVAAVAGPPEVSAAEAEAREAAASRRFITRTVLWVWAGSLIAYVVGTAIWSPTLLSAGIIELIKTAVLPLTTLVLGYYLSRSR